MAASARRQRQPTGSIIERGLIVVLSAALVAALLNYLPLLRRAAESTAALEAARDEELPAIYYTKHSAGFDDTLVSFSDDTEPQPEALATDATAGAAPASSGQYEPTEADALSEEDRTYWQDVIA